MDKKQLNLFFGHQPDEKFLEDLETIKKFQENEIFDLIEKTIKWYTDDKIFEEEWNKITENLNQEQKEEKLKPIRALLFIFKEFTSENINKEELKEDFDAFEISQKYLEHFLNKLKPVEKEFRKKSLKDEKPYENTLISIDWRIDTKHYRDGIEKKVAAIELIIYDKGEKETIQFDLNIKSLRHLIYTLKKVEEKLCQ